MKFTTSVVTFVGAVPLFVLCVWEGSSNAQVMFESGFEAGDLAGFSAEGCCNSIVDLPVRVGKRAIKFESAPGARRAEVKTKTDDGKTGEERWFSFSVWLPRAWLTDPKAAIVTQWHERPDPCEDWRSPPLAMAYVGGKVRLTRKWDANPCSTSPTGQGQKVFYLEPMAVERWTDWVFHVKWSHRDDGLIEVWRDGRKVVTETGPNTYNDTRSNYLKIGMYNYQGSTTTRVVYYDEIKVGGPRSTYDEMAPGSGVPPVTTGEQEGGDGGGATSDARPDLDAAASETAVADAAIADTNGSEVRTSPRPDGARSSGRSSDPARDHDEVPETSTGRPRGGFGGCVVGAGNRKEEGWVLLLVALAVLSTRLRCSRSSARRGAHGHGSDGGSS